MPTALATTPASGRAATASRAVTNSRSVRIHARPEVTRAAIAGLDLAAPAVRALGALGLEDRVTLRSCGAFLWPDEDCGPIVVDVALDVRDAGEHDSTFTISTRFDAACETARARLLEAWSLVGPLADELTRRAAHTVKEHAEAHH